MPPRLRLCQHARPARRGPRPGLHLPTGALERVPHQQVARTATATVPSTKQAPGPPRRNRGIPSPIRWMPPVSTASSSGGSVAELNHSSCPSTPTSPSLGASGYMTDAQYGGFGAHQAGPGPLPTGPLPACVTIPDEADGRPDRAPHTPRPCWAKPGADKAAQHCCCPSRGQGNVAGQEIC